MPDNPIDPQNDWNVYYPTRTRVVAFIDLLGFKSSMAAVATTDEVWRFLEYHVRMQYEGPIGPAYDENLRPGANAVHRARATVFSDCWVFSFPFGVFDELHPENPGWVIDELAQKIGHIFHSAFQIGCLVRGGITLGHLMHNERMVFGEGLAEAYRIEHKVAYFPRVILSDAAAAHFGSHPFLFKEPEVDGFTCLNFVKASAKYHSGGGYPETIMHERVVARGEMEPEAKCKWFWLQPRIQAYLDSGGT